MKLLSTGLVLGLAITAVADSEGASAGPDYWDGIDPTEVAPQGCAKPTAYFSCFKIASKFAYCDASDDACNCSSVMIDKSCFNQDCGTAYKWDSGDSSLFCTGTATKGLSNIALQTPSPTAPASTDATPTASSTPTGTAAAGSSSGTPSGSAASKPNAGERSMKVSTGGLFAVAAAAVGSLLYRL